MDFKTLLPCLQRYTPLEGGNLLTVYIKNVWYLFGSDNSVNYFAVTVNH